MQRTLALPLLLIAGLAHADDGEWRVGAGGGGTAVNARAGGAEGTAIGYEAHGRVGYGVSNTIELGIVGSYASVSNVPFDGAALAGQTGKLFADLSTAGLLAELRWTPGVGLTPAFERTSLFFAARAGTALLVRTSQELLSPRNLLLVAPEDGIELAPVARRRHRRRASPWRPPLRRGRARRNMDKGCDSLQSHGGGDMGLVLRSADDLMSPRELSSREAEPHLREILNADEVALLLGVGRNSVYEAAGRGEIPHRRLGKRLLFSRAAVLEWVSCKVPVSTER